jgi:hypothetical protein|tara:strand:- start:53524 stop:54117 length:594 start_codon:yes stop_codon:yes gene_type:complete
MKNIMLIILISLFTLSCAKTVKIDHEGETKSGMLEEVPKWFVEKEGNKGLLNKKDKFYLYGVGVATSPDLQLAMDKATMIAKADLADVLHGEMNKNASVFIQEIGDDGNTIVSSEAQSTIVNMIKQTKVQGWEQWKISISITNTEQYRVYMGLQLPLGEYNKLQELIKAEAKKHINRDIVKNNAKTAIDELTAVATE